MYKNSLPRSMLPHLVGRNEFTTQLLRATYIAIVFYNEPATTEIYTYAHTLSLHDALPICYRGTTLSPTAQQASAAIAAAIGKGRPALTLPADCAAHDRSEEHTSELQSLMRISYAVFCLKIKSKRIR